MIIIPDVHGRNFWRKPVEKALGKEHIIFLGDYLDPYQYEDIYPSEAFLIFEEIVSLKMKYPDDITLLLGNHDLHYISPDIAGGRKDYARMVDIRDIIIGNAGLFRMAQEAVINSKKFLFTHAGVRQGWLDFEDEYLGQLTPEDVCHRLNEMWLDEDQRPMLLDILADVSYARWGLQPYGSPIWNDVIEMDDDVEELPGYYQVFGHSQQEHSPVIGEHFACLDCRRAFRIDDLGQILTISVI